jgi:hypothetical protein
MNRKLVAVFAVFALLIACSKDKFETKPSISIKSYNTKNLLQDQDLIITFDYKDREGDLANGKFIYFPQRLNEKPLSSGEQAFADSVESVLSSKIPKKAEGEVELTLPYTFLHKSDAENDTLQFHFVLQDAAGNRSDSVKSDIIVIISQ